ncbi:CHASE2 domain-containing protein [Ramlibacter sp. MAHUQ-53]|uniref:CHASE2 domain-containing protein n=1 Tax=unclassified Ramlibacter TaxID=2617605 RepID=UPI00362AADEC
MPQTWRSRLAAWPARVGGWPTSRVLGGLLVLFCAWIVMDLRVFHVGNGLSRSTYDVMVRSRLWAAPPDPRIVIVDIDEASLARMSGEFGRWPWPRDTLATALAYLEGQQPAAIAWDILFADPDRLSPGGDAAFDAQVAAGRRSHFSVVRLPASNDGASQLTQAQLPGLWASPAQGAAPATVALIPPALPAVAAAPLGLTNATPDEDGVIRRHAAGERLADGGVLQSLPLAVLGSLDPAAARARTEALRAAPPGAMPLVAWRHKEGAYPRISFADLFAAAEGQPGAAPLPPLAGKVVVIGATAPALHDLHATALSARQPGVETLATLIDNELNARHVAELPAAVQAALAMALCASIAWRMRFRSLAALDAALVAVPGALMAVSFASLHTDRLFLDLQMAAGWTLGFLALVRLWAGWRRAHWCAPPAAAAPLAVWPLRAGAAGWSEAGVSRLILALERQAPACRLLLPASGPHAWPALSRLAAVVGPAAELAQALDRLARGLDGEVAAGALHPVPEGAGTGRMLEAAAQAWAAQGLAPHKESLA